MNKEAFDWDKFYWFFAFIAAGVLAGILIGIEVAMKLKISINTASDRYLVWLIGALIGLTAFIFLNKKDDFVKRASLLGFMILVLAFRMLNK